MVKKIELLKEIEALKAIVFQLQSRVTSLETRIAVLQHRPIEMPYQPRWSPYVTSERKPGDIIC